MTEDPRVEPAMRGVRPMLGGRAVAGALAPLLVWELLEALKVSGLVCFYNERVDLTLDGVPQERPRTRFS